MSEVSAFVVMVQQDDRVVKTDEEEVEILRHQDQRVLVVDQSDGEIIGLIMTAPGHNSITVTTKPNMPIFPTLSSDDPVS